MHITRQKGIIAYLSTALIPAISLVTVSFISWDVKSHWQYITVYIINTQNNWNIYVVYNIKPVLHSAVHASTCCLRAKICQIARHMQGARASFYPADHTQRLAEQFWHDHNFLRAPCDYRFAVSTQGTCTKKERYPCDLHALVASLKWRIRGEKWHPNNYVTRTCVSLSTCVPRVKYASSEYNLSDLCLSSACAAWLASTRSTPHGTITCLLNVSCSSFGCSVKVQLGELI
jgi:hypothetical protein